MPITIGSNIASLMVQRQLGKASDAQSSVFERLSSGMRINRAADDAAGLSIATSLNADARIYTQALRNVNDGLSVLNLAQGGLQSLTTITERLKELTFQSANGTYSIEQRRALDSESDALTSEYNRIVNTVSFNGIKILNGDMRELFLQLGAGTGTTLSSGLGMGIGQYKGNGTVISQVNYSTSAGGSSRSIQLVDVNGDGKLDMIYGGTGVENAFAVQLANGDGSFRAETTYAGFFSSDVKTADVNNDGYVDIIGIGNGSGEAAIALGNGNGTFRYRSVVDFGIGTGNLNSFAVSDFNNDGIMDMVAIDDTASSGAGYGVVLGNGDGTFRIASTSMGLQINGLASIQVSDFNNDGRKDLIYNLDYNGDALQIAYGRGDGSFSSGMTIDMGGGDTAGALVGDLNGDGHNDIVVASSTGSGLRVRIGNGNGSFRAIQSYETDATYTTGTIADINGDGITDYLSAVYGTGQVELRLGNGDGTFLAKTTYNTGLTSLFGTSAVGDVNQDGAAEIFFAQNGLNVVRLNQNKDFKSTIETLNLNTRESALDSLSYIEAASARISKELSSVGALMSRLAVAGSNLSTSREGVIGASSRIMDSDVAADASNLLRNQILQQAATALLAQVNQQPSLALQLLR